jgi:hypothetical protein
MAETTSFNPGVVIDGVTYHPPGWMWVLAFASREIDWAVEATREPEFALTVSRWRHDQKVHELEQRISQSREHLAALESELSDLQKGS